MELLAAGRNAIATVEEVAATLRVPKSWVYEHVRPSANPRLPHFKLGKYLRFRRSEIENFIQAEVKIPVAR